MSDSPTDWQATFGRLFDAAVERYQAGHQKAVGLVDEQGHAFLESTGHTEQEFFDFVEDFAKGGEPTRAKALEIAAVRRDYFLREQGGRRSLQIIAMSDLPSKDAEVEGIGWLPRLIPKAEAKLRGEMPPDLMYCCGGDRKFFRTQGIDPAEFLRVVWKAGNDRFAIIDWVKKNRRPE